MQQSSLFGALGKAVHEAHGENSGPSSLTAPIAKSLSRLSELETDISRLSSEGKGSWMTPKRLVVLGVVFVLLVLLVRTGYNKAQEFKAHIVEGKHLWEQGKQVEAIERFKLVIEKAPGLIASEDRPTIFQRVIERESAQGNTSYAKKVIQIALQNKVSLSLNNPAARAILEELQRAKESPVASNKMASDAASQADGNDAPIGQKRDDNIPTRDELISLVYKTAAIASLKHTLGTGPSPEEFIELTHEAARQFGADKHGHSRFLLTLAPDKDKSMTVKGVQGRVLTYGSEQVIFLKNKVTDRYSFLSCTVDGVDKMNTSGR